MMRELGGVFGIAVAVAVFAGAGSYASANAFLDGFAPAIGVVAALSLAGAIVALALPGRRQAAETAPAGTVSALEAGVEENEELVRAEVLEGSHHRRRRGAQPNR
jgi:hypothetical protein